MEEKKIQNIQKVQKQNYYDLIIKRPQKEIKQEIENLLQEIVSQFQGNDESKQKFNQSIQHFSFQSLQKQEKYLKQIQIQNQQEIDIVISGFLSQDTDKIEEWQKLVELKSQNDVFALIWAATSTAENLDYWFKQLKDFSQQQSQNQNKPFWKKLVDGALLVAEKLITNPFINALQETQRTGILLAHLLFEHQIFNSFKINLYGFSLGTRVIIECLIHIRKLMQNQRNNIQSFINNVILMGGASEHNLVKDLQISEIINGKLYNFYSCNDNVLKYLFQGSTFMQVPIGLKEVSNNQEIINIDCKEFIKGHLDYRNKIEEIIKRIQKKI